MSDATFLMWIVLPLLILNLVTNFLSLLLKCMEGKAWASVGLVFSCLGMIVIISRVATIAGRI